MTKILSMKHAHRVKGDSVNIVHAGRTVFGPFVRRNTVSTDLPTHLFVLYFNRTVV